jgi:hypothetical protein
MMEQLTLEGTWEEILLHSSELTGQRVKLVVLSNESSSRSTANTLDKLLEDRVGQVHFQPSDLSERSGEAFADLLMTQHDPSGLNP